MKKYQIGSIKTKASIGIDIKGSYVISTLKSFFEELKKDFKDVNIEVTSYGRGEKPFFIMISRLKDQDEYVGWLIGEKLCEL